MISIKDFLGYLFILATLILCATAGTLLGNKFNNQSTEEKETYVCVIPSSDPNLPCRVKMLESVYVENAITIAPKD